MDVLGDLPYCSDVTCLLRAQPDKRHVRAFLGSYQMNEPEVLHPG
jgi:hypothetical protein